MPNRTCELAIKSERSLSIKLSARLDATAARQIETHLKRPLKRIDVECRELDAIDPVGARCLAHILEAAATNGIVVALHGLKPRLRRQLERHPLRRYWHADDDVFLDPDSDFDHELPASRH